MSTILLLILTSFLIALTYFRWSRRNLYAAAAKIEGPAGWPVIGNALSFWCNSDDILQKVNCVLDVNHIEPIKFWLGPFLMVVLRNPVHLEKIMSSSKFAYKHELYKFLEKLLGDGLISASGLKPKYKMHRRIIQPLFDLKFVESTVDLMQNNINICMEKMEQHANGKLLDVHDFIIKCSMDMFGEIIAGQNINSQKNGSTKICEALTDLYDLVFSRLLKIWLHPDFIYDMLPAKKKFDQVYRDFHDFAQKALTNSRKMRKLADEKNDQFIPTIDKLTEYVEKNPDAISEEDLMDHILTLLAASSDTVAVIASFAIICFGMYPQFQEKSVQEIRNVLGDTPRNITLEDIYKLKYLDMCIKDVLRLFPIAPYLLKSALEDFTLDKWIIPEGTALVIPIFNLHRDRAYWQNPEHFYPDHFLPENVKGRHVYAYLPFSAGPRGCIGKTLANIGIKLIMVNILQRFEIQADGKVPDIELKSDISVRPKKGYNCRLKKRHWKRSRTLMMHKLP